MAYKLGIDTGGTFTDLVLFDEGKKNVSMTKVLSTPSNLTQGILTGVRKITELCGITPEDISFLIHGTTVATNAILEHKGAKTALLITEGFKDVLSIVRQDRPLMYDFFAQRPEALVPRHLRFEVKERVLYDGTVLHPLDESQAREIALQLRKENVEAVAICLLHSYVNATHEKKLKEILMEFIPDLKISISCEIVPEIREYERMSTTILNSYVHPVMEKYIMLLAEELKKLGFREELHVMQSNGGIMTKKMAAEKCINTALSGPAAGVVGGVYLAKLAGSDHVITVDMGGTSFDICLAYQEKFALSNQSEIGGHAIKVPMIDIHTIGAGGGSIGWIDPGGGLRVGPQSAGAKPGPACYGFGGEEPTVTDANLVLGRINPEYYLGGKMKVDIEKSIKAIKEKIADPLGLTVEEAAEGITRVVNVGMVKGIRYISIEKGYDPREFTMVSFGGAGSLHALEMAEDLQILKVIVPLIPGATSAWGLLMSDFRHDFTRTYFRRVGELDLAHLNMVYYQMETEALSKMKEEKVAGKDTFLVRTAKVRYFGQGYEIEVVLPGGEITPAALAQVQQSFHQAHEDCYGYQLPEAETALVNIGVSAIGKLPRPELATYPIQYPDASQAVKRRRRVFMHGDYKKAIIYDRYQLEPGNVFFGPAIVEQSDTTTLIWEGQKCEVDRYKNLIIYTGTGGVAQ